MDTIGEFQYSSYSFKSRISDKKNQYQRLCHLNNADGLPGQMVGCVEEEGQEQNGAAVPADKIYPKQLCLSKTPTNKGVIYKY